MAGRRESTGAEAAPSGFGEVPQVAYAIPEDEIGDDRIKPVLEAARKAGLLERKTARISGRVNPALIAQAKRRTAMQSDSDLIEFALASVALDDPFLDAFRQVRGTIDPDLDLGD